MTNYEEIRHNDTMGCRTLQVLCEGWDAKPSDVKGWLYPNTSPKT